MDGVLKGLEPAGVMGFFEELCQIPHPSYQEKAISDYLVAFAKERNLEYYQDTLYNVIIIKAASPGYEQAEPVIIQGHMDMVCEKDADCTKDMTKEGLDLEIEGDFIRAKGTTLGGDDGIAVAMGLAILDDDEIPHPRLELVITVSEEVGMEGANGIDLSMLRGKKLLNLDSEEEGVFLAGCAGGGVVTLTYPLDSTGSAAEPKARVDQEITAVRERQTEPAVSGEVGSRILEVRIGGLRGGHSGTEINKGRGNANILLGDLLYRAYREVPFSLISLQGGSKDNAITREAEARLVSTDPGQLQEVLSRIAVEITEDYRGKEPQLLFVIGETEEFSEAGEELQETFGGQVPEEITGKFLSFLQELPYGVIAMCHGMPDLVETSLNLGIVETCDHKIRLSYCVRSSVEEAFEELTGRLEKTALDYGADYSIKGRYPAWEFAEVSPLRQQMAEIYREMFGAEPQVDVMHAGVECGQLSQKIPGLDCVSFGPNLYDIHTPQERMSISSVQRTYAFVLEILKRTK
jgi:dipeptidase D